MTNDYLTLRKAKLDMVEGTRVRCQPSPPALSQTGDGTASTPLVGGRGSQNRKEEEH